MTEEFLRQLASDISEIKANITHIKEAVDRQRKAFEEHCKDELSLYKTVNRSAVLIGILWAVFGIASLTALSQNILASVKIGG